MLCSLTIHKLAIVESLELDFEKGLTVLTGETGAGKSILLTALGLALGNRADPAYIRPGSPRAEINLEFDVSDAPLARQWLKDNELAENDHCLIRRILNQDGRSKASINNRPVTLQSLQALGQTLVEIHGQHAHLTLLKNSEQQRLLDDSADNRVLVDQIQKLYQQWNSIRKQRDTQLNAAEEQAAREEFVRYQVHELEQLGAHSIDYQALVEEHTLQANLGDILRIGQQQLAQLYENEQQSVYALLNESLNALSELSQMTPELAETVELLDEAQIQVREAGQQLRRKLGTLEADPPRLIWLEEQLSSIHSLARKHRIKPEQLSEHLDTLRKTLDEIENRDDYLETLEQSIRQILADYHQAAERLSQRRQQYAQHLEQKISEIIRELGMPQGAFCIGLNTQSSPDPHPDGYDRIDFQVTTNPGLPPRSLAKIASGGELSRIGLAVKVATTGRKPTPTMIFDEVDAGIGGGTAEIVGKQLRTLGCDRQVICVTHLPQVAAQAHNHLLVEKISAAASTLSQVRALSAKERKLEIARMLGGVELTEHTLAHAEEMLRSGAEF